VRGSARTPATRSALLQLRRELAQVDRAAGLLRRKREALVGELFRSARPALDLRERIARQAALAYDALLEALALHGSSGLTALGLPEQRIEVELRPGIVWGVPVTEVVSVKPVRRSLAARGTAPSLTHIEGVEAADHFEELLALLLQTATAEERLRRLGAALARATRQMRVLEERLAPTIAERIARVREHLDQEEREMRVRLGIFAGRR
jgi:V/A-type H+-transporting ATPase subunit D